MKILADEHIPYIRDYFQDEHELVLLPGREITAKNVESADLLFVRAVTTVNQALLAHAKVQFVGSVTAGLNHLDTAWLDQAGIAWAHAGGFNAAAVADYVACVVAALQRQQKLATQGIRAAIIGCGQVGSRVCRHLQVLQFDVLQCDPFRAEQEPGFISTPLADIADVDLIALHVPLTHAGPYPTYQMIDHAFLKRQKPGAILLNAGRGETVDVAALKVAGGHLRWCFDVWAAEPNIDLHVLADTQIATPHIAGYSAQSQVRGLAMVYQQACARGFLKATLLPVRPIPEQQLLFAGENHHWQDVLLGIFNPIVMTLMMKTMLFSDESNRGIYFDQLRKHFRNRHEFASTTVKVPSMLAEDKRVLEGLGVRVETVVSA